MHIIMFSFPVFCILVWDIINDIFTPRVWFVGCRLILFLKGDSHETVLLFRGGIFIS